jgi:hypothetical protein
MKAAIGAVLVALALAGCSSGGGSGGDGATTAASLGAKLGCTVQESEGDNQLFTREDVTCSYSGETVNIVTFASDEAKASYLEAAGGFGGIYVEGPDWVVGVEAQATAQNVRGALGGMIR